MLYIDEQQNIKLTRGDSGFFTISLTNAKGKPYVPQEGDSLRFAMGKTYGVTNALVLKQIPMDTMTLEIEPSDTKELPFAKYKYDIELTDAQGHVTTVILGEFTVDKEVY